MSQTAVEQIVGKLVISPEFRQALAADPTAALAGYDLTADEREALLRADMKSFSDAGALLDERVSKRTVPGLLTSS
jgi:hypothetical protein